MQRLSGRMGERGESKKEGVFALQLSALVGGEEGGKSIQKGGHEKEGGRHRPVCTHLQEKEGRLKI